MKTVKFFSALSVALLLSCSDGGDGDGGGTGTCNNKEYNATLYDCVKGEIIGSCRGQDYYAEYEHCDNGVIVDGGEDFSPRSSNSGQGGNSTGKLTYQGQTYRTVKIGNQTWMAENLNYAVSGSKCVGASGSSGTLVDNGGRCGDYGRLYDWATAKTVCPKGWHLPSDAEWITLANYAGGISNAGTKLKARSGWNGNGNGTDDYGFSALPGGYGGSSGSFWSIGDYGDWWSSPEYGATDAWARFMGYDISEVGRYDNDDARHGLYSVRCVQDQD